MSSGGKKMVLLRVLIVCALVLGGLSAVDTDLSPIGTGSAFCVPVLGQPCVVECTLSDGAPQGCRVNP